MGFLDTGEGRGDRDLYKGESKEEQGGGLFWMGGMSVCGMDTRADLSLLEDLSTNDSVSGLILSNNLLCNLCSFIWKSVHLEKNSLLKIACME